MAQYVVHIFSPHDRDWSLCGVRVKAFHEGRILLLLPCAETPCRIRRPCQVCKRLYERQQGNTRGKVASPC